jgi:hypothetical protein
VSTPMKAPAPTRRATPIDTRRLRRIGAAVLLPLGPLSIAAVRAVLPYSTTDGTATMIEGVAADPDAAAMILWFSLVGMIALVPSCLAAARAAQRRAPVLSLIGVCLAVPAFVMLFFSAGDALLPVLADGTVDTDTAARLAEGFFGLAPVAAATVLFIAGHLIGIMLLGAALWRSHAAPVWAAVAVIASQPLHLIFAVIVPNNLLDALAWALAAAGLLAVSFRVARTPDDDWDLAPMPR